MSPAIVVDALRAEDREGWEPLARGYKAFYGTTVTDAEYDAAWRRLMQGHVVHGLAARVDGRVVGIAHYLLHASAWSERVCYLQDLFTVPDARGQGVARALIAAVGERAREAGCARCYWQTKADNAVARALYDRVARHDGFIRYDLPMGEPPR